MDSPFLQEDVPLTDEAAPRVRANVQRLVDFTSKVEKNRAPMPGCFGQNRTENFAQKLIARLQKCNDLD